MSGAVEYIFSGAARAYSNGGTDGLLDFAGKLWTLPNTFAGLAAGVAGLPFGATFEGFNSQYNGFVFANYPWGPGGAITIGNVILTTTPTLDMLVPTYAAGAAGPPYTDLVNLGSHESGHTYQYQALGPFFLPAYLLSGGAFTSKSPFETAADNFGKNGKGWWPW
jgi:hypothetical protein